jgi:hypothetical protein
MFANSGNTDLNGNSGLERINPSNQSVSVLIRDSISTDYPKKRAVPSIRTTAIPRLRLRFALPSLGMTT